jgi:hypothetical protein
VLCGKIIVASGAFAGDLKDGRFASRKVPEAVGSRPVK